MLELLKEASVEDNSASVLQKRRLLFPLLASMATSKHNHLFCNNIYYEWFNKYKLPENTSEYPLESLKNWYLKSDKINKMILLAKEILNSKHNYYLSKIETRTSLYNKEVIVFHNNSLKNIPLDIDRWIALIVGNSLYNDFQNRAQPKLFNKDHKIDHNQLFDLILNSNTVYKVIPFWAKDLFKGIDMSENQVRLRLHTVLNHIDFSYSIFKNVDFSGCLLGGVRFDYSIFENVDCSHCYMWGTSFRSIQIRPDCYATYVVIADVLISFDLFSGIVAENEVQTILKIREKRGMDQHDHLIKILADLFGYLVSKKGFQESQIDSQIEFENAELRTMFYKNLRKVIASYESDNYKKLVEPPPSH